ncbi:MAG: D-tyrosyl-tRNA(Tyr) deacylase [Synergistaceae bacterium]|jgi:D-tyrosyl-tRNA(Tyr) deacylase|nr:D-tyrosyl-tRNA(Tyr) deacylase [Synergistaceae bacterium]
MRAVVQRAARAAVSVNGKISGKIDGGLCILLGVGAGDEAGDAEWLADKIVNLRVFEDGDGKMNRSLLDTGGGVLVVSQFTLYGDCRKGRRPSFTGAAPAEEGKRLYEYFVERVKYHGAETACGVFQARMLVEIVNDGPVTLILDTRQQNTGQERVG